jgi:four helix bundle protein
MIPGAQVGLWRRREGGQIALMAPYERFEAFHLCHRLAMAVYRETVTFPKSELYGLTAQARRAAFSAAANIVEGSARRGKAEFRRFLDISLASLAELGYAIQFAHELGLLDDSRKALLDAAHTSASKATWVLYDSMRRA